MNYPEKQTPLDAPIHKLLSKRWSPLAISDQPVEKEKLDRIFEAMRWAPSSFNEQPWRIVYATKDNSEAFENLASLLLEGNAWAKNAYVLMLICSTEKFTRNDKHNVHHAYDTGAAVANMLVEATDLGLVAHQMAGFDSDRAPKIVDLPEGVEPLTMMALGYYGEIETLKEDWQKREASERSRKPVSELVFKGKWPK
jgi:nitroreductase